MKMSTDAARPRLARQWLHSSLFGLLAGFSANASAVDVDAGDYTALPAGTNLTCVIQRIARESWREWRKHLFCCRKLGA